jgi:hypothetical protein
VKWRFALVGYGHSVSEIDLVGTKPLLKKQVFRHYKKCQRFAPEILVVDGEDSETADPWILEVRP